ncbi:hypothetical protein E3N88_03126 [Mikania micrantha]|uniref:DEAD-box RNA helicase Q domain-containing protein n=1 Tax=Mikania micrantha TaxID=192012 RepID=A0A5N6Q8H2_9ASTR|nr:hypothetical protein E3N88_03126 [Mikania micrantha]
MRLKVLSYVAFLVFIITTQSLPSANAVAISRLPKVYDVTGKRVLHDAPYYISPVIWAKGTEIKLTDTKDNQKVCPFYVVQDPAEVNRDGLFNFVLTGRKSEMYLLTSHTLSITSRSPNSSCDESSYWQIPDVEAKAPSNFITTGPRGCFNMSLYADNKEVRYLGYSGTAPFVFVFRKPKSGYISGGRGGGWNNRSGGRDREFNPLGDDDGTDQQFADQENTGINFDAYEDIPVETSGDNVPPPVNIFSEIDLGDALNLNIRRCKYVKPTPVQHHAIPISLGDLNAEWNQNEEIADERMEKRTVSEHVECEKLESAGIRGLFCGI